MPASEAQIRANRENAQLASILPTDLSTMSDEEFEAFHAETMARAKQNATQIPQSDASPTPRSRVDVPIAVGKRR